MKLNHQPHATGHPSPSGEEPGIRPGRAAMSNSIILTGGPGAGKTTVLLELQKRGFAIMEEVARDIIREQMNSGGNAVPWADTVAYKQIMLERTVDQFFAEKDPSQYCFFDRGIIDIISYSRIIREPIEPYLDACGRQYRYHPVAFIFPPWELIYTTDTERKQSFEEAIMTCDMIREAYHEYGYKTIDVPLTSVAERADFILASLKMQQVN